MGKSGGESSWLSGASRMAANKASSFSARICCKRAISWAAARSWASLSWSFRVLAFFSSCSCCSRWAWERAKCRCLTCESMSFVSTSASAKRSSGVNWASRAFSAFCRSWAARKPTSLSRPKAICRLNTACIWEARGFSESSSPSSNPL